MAEYFFKVEKCGAVHYECVDQSNSQEFKEGLKEFSVKRITRQEYADRVVDRRPQLKLWSSK